MKLEPLVCPMCYHLNTEFTPLEKGVEPKPGDYSVCWECGMVMKFYESKPGYLNVRPTTGPEAAEFMAEYPHMVSMGAGGNKFDEILGLVRKMLGRPEGN